MPLNHNDFLDDPQAFDRQRSFTGGMVTSARANLLSEDQCVALYDLEVDTSLVVSNRFGFRRLGNLGDLVGSNTAQGLWWYSTPTHQYLLALVGGALYRCASDHTWVLVSASAAGDATAPGHAAQVVNRFYLSTADAGSRGRTWDGTGLAASAAGSILSDGPAKLSLLMAHRYRMFGLNADSVDEVYCSRFLPDDTAPFSLTGVAIQPFRVGDGEGDPIIAMTPWKGLFSLVVLKAASIKMVDVTPASNTTTAATVTADFQVQHVSSDVGCVASRSVARTGNDILFLSEDGVRSLAKTLQDGDGEVSDPLSKPIQDIVDRINPAARQIAAGIFWEGKYLLAVPLGTSTVNNAVLTLNVRTGSWGVWTGAQVVQWAVASYRGQPQRLVYLDARGQVLEYRDHLGASATATDFRDNVTGSDVRVPWFLRTRGMTCQEGFSPKQWDFAEFEFDRSSAIIDIDVIIDNDASSRRLARKVRTGFGGLLLPFVLPAVLGQLKVKRIPKSLTHYPNCREIMFEIRESAELTTAEQSESGVLRMRSVQAAAYVETMEEQA